MKRTVPAAVLAAALSGLASLAAQEPQNDGQSFRFRTGVELINITATVTDLNGRFVPGLRKEDFRVYEDERPQPITHFNAERVPISVGIVLDTSGSMVGEKMAAARNAIEHLLLDLLGPDDEVFLYRFDNRPQLVEGWTTDRRRVAAELRHIQPRGATSLYDAVAEAVPLALTGRHKKRALLIISDGNDTNSQIQIGALKSLIRETEVLVYAIGIDAQAETTWWPFGGRGGVQHQQRRNTSFLQFLGLQRPRPLPFPIPGGGRRGPPPRPGPPTPRGPAYPPRTPFPPANPPATSARPGDERVNVAALRDITDDSGGRTEIIRQARDLNPATASIADELSKQYYLGYPASGPKDGRWHTIRVDVRDSNYRVRARRGYVATP
jgi:VWFA-related protein